MKYAFIHSEHQHYGVNRLCNSLDVSSSGYYDWVNRPLSETKKVNQRLVTKIRCYHQASRRTYGSPRIQKDLIASGEAVSRQRVARLMRAEGIQSKMAKRFVVTTNSKSTTSPAPDHLQRQFRTEGKNQAWVSDTTFIRTRQGWLYLAVLLDLYSRQIVGWAMSERNDTKLVADALTMAIWRRGSLKDVIVLKIKAVSYRKLLKENNILCMHEPKRRMP